MALNLGSAAISTIRLGTATPSKVMLGDVQVWPVAVTNPWTPADLPDTIGWFDAIDSSTIVEVDGKVTQWTNKIVGAITQANSAQQPTYQTAGPQGLPCVACNNSLLFGPYASVDYLETSIFMVAELVNYDSSEDILCGIGQTEDTGRCRTFYRAGSDGRMFGFAGWAADFFPTNPAFAFPTGKAILVSCKQTGGVQPNDALIRANQAQENGPAAYGAAFYPVRNHYLSVGSLQGGSASSFYADVKMQAFVAVKRAVTMEEIYKMEGYLAHRYLLAGDLPADHPYKNAPPTK